MADSRPLLIAYDGSSFAKEAIAESGRELQAGRRAIVLTVREPLEQVPFMSTAGATIDARTFAALQESGEKEASAVAEEGAELARSAGFEAEARVETGATPWERIVEVGEELEAGLIVIGSRGLTGLKRAVIGSVAASVAQHSGRNVLIVHS
jgi:nucleotide-binding universal stress UspA family protein